jgi:hypothetical protein
MNLKLLKTIAIGTYLVAGLLAAFFSFESRGRIIDWGVATNSLSVFILPYGIFMLITWRMKNRLDFALVSVVVSMLVLAYTLISYIPAVYIYKCHLGPCLDFAITPFIMTVGTPWIFLVGVLGINVFLRLTRRSV